MVSFIKEGSLKVNISVLNTVRILITFVMIMIIEINMKNLLIPKKSMLCVDLGNLGISCSFMLPRSFFLPTRARNYRNDVNKFQGKQFG